MDSRGRAPVCRCTPAPHLLSKSSSLGARSSSARLVCSSAGLWCTSALTRRRCRSAKRMKAGCGGGEGGWGGGGGVGGGLHGAVGMGVG